MSSFSWKNSLILQISGEEASRLLNMAAFHKIRLWDVTQKKDGIRARICPSDFRRLFLLRKKTAASVRIVRREGPYFLWKRTRHRRIGIVCGILSFASLYIMSLFVWDISFLGNTRYTDSYLLDFVRREGYHPGLLISQISCDSLEKELRSRFSDITWVSARIEGTRLVVEVEENGTAGKRAQEPLPCTLTAAKSGTVDLIVTRKGVPMVEKGSKVEEGDVLVSGNIPITDDSGTVIAYEQTAASADVWIVYEEPFYLEVPRVQEIRRCIRKKESAGLVLFGHRFCLPGSLSAGKGELVTTQKQLKLFDNFYLPVYLEGYSCREYEQAQVSYTDEELKTQAGEVYLKFLLDLDKLGVEIIQNNVTIRSGVDSYIMEGSFLLRENAVREAALEYETAPDLSDRGDSE